MSRPLPSPDEAARILAAKRTRPAPRPPPPAGRSLAKLIKALDERFGRGPDALVARWSEIVGETLAARTEPVKLSKPRNGSGATLELKVDGPSAALIQHQAPEILARVNLYLGAGSVERLRVVQGSIRRPPSAVRGTAASAQARRRARPLDAAAEADLAASLSGVDEGPLKSALSRLGREVLRNSR